MLPICEDMSEKSVVCAIQRGDLSWLHHILEESEWDIGSEPLDSKGQTALHIACANGHLHIVQYLVNKKGCSVTVEDVYGHTPLILSIIQTQWKIANFLLQNVPNSVINELEGILTSYNKSVLTEVAKERLVESFINKQWKIANILLQIAPNCAIDELEGTLKSCKKFAVVKEAFVVSFKNGYFRLLKYLTNHITHSKTLKRAMKNSCRFSGNLHMVHYLFHHCQCKMSDDMSEVHIACIEGDVDTVKTALESNGPSLLGAADRFGTTPMHYATLEPNLLKVIVQYAGEELLNIADDRGNTPLHHSVKYECIESVTTLVGAPGCDVNIQNGNGDTPLHTGVKNVEVVKCLLESGRSRCDIYNHKGLTPFHKAIAKEVMESIKLMLTYGTNVLQSTNDKIQNAPIHIACKYYSLYSLKLLLSCKNCDPNQQNAKGNTALHIACSMRNDELCMKFLEVLISTPGINLTLANHEGIAPFEVVDSDGNTLLHFAFAKGNYAMVKVLMKNGANILEPNRHGDAPIHIACKHSRLDVLKELLAFDSCNPNQLNADGDTALHIVTRMRGNRQKFKMAEFLLKNKADVLKPDKHGDAPIHIACKHFRLDILKELVASRCCSPNQQNAEGNTPLHIVCRRRTSTTAIELNFLEVLTSTPGINTAIMNHEGITPFEVVDSIGNTLLHIACAEGNLKVVRLLVSNGANVLKLDWHGNSPIHIACEHSRVNILKELIALNVCDPNQQNAKGDTALHIACKIRLKALQIIEILTSVPGINPTIVNHEGIAPFEVVDSDGNTLLHIACAEGNTRMANLLLINGADILKPDRQGDAPIHIACKHARLYSLKLLSNFTSCDPNQQNASGDTALHIVCKETFHGQMKLLNTLTSIVGIDPEIVNHEGHTPIEVKGISYSAIDTIKNFLELKRSSIQAYLKIFVVGNSGNGKSTLIKAVTTEASQFRKYAPLSKIKYVNPSDVPPHTAGIVPIPFNSKHFGNAVLYDFAGQHEYYSSHAAVMENLILPSPPLFLLLIDISKSKEVIREELVYWWHFINNQSQKAAAPPHVILAGSHKDRVKSSNREELEVFIRDCIKRTPVTFEFIDYFPLDCRKLVSQGLSALLTQLNTTCQTLRGIVDVKLHCHILNALLRAQEFQDLIYCKLVDIMNKIESDDAPLPKTSSQLISLLKSLNDQGYILLLEDYTDGSNSWVILKPDVLLTEVNGSMFAPKEHSAISTGVVTLSKLKVKFTEHNHEVIVEYMFYLEFCFRIKDQHTLDMITKNEIHGTATTERYYFFPGLVRVENPTDVCQPHQSIDYEYGWLYKCSEETEQLTTRFLHVLILRLAFACEPTDDPTETESVVLLRSCSVWKHGIAWWTNDPIEVIIEVGLQCRWVAVMMRCPATERVQCAELRSKVILTVLKTKQRFCPAITMKEYLIAPSSLKYPFEGRELTLYSMREIARTIVEGKKCARDTKGKNLITLPQLLPFEPFHNMGNLIWKFFSGDTSLAVTPEELTQLAVKCRDKLAELNTAFQSDDNFFQTDCEKGEVGKCVALFHILQRRGRFKTWRDCQQEFCRFSIFCEQNPLVRMMSNHLFSTHCKN